MTGAVAPGRTPSTTQTRLTATPPVPLLVPLQLPPHLVRGWSRCSSVGEGDQRLHYIAHVLAQAALSGCP